MITHTLEIFMKFLSTLLLSCFLLTNLMASEVHSFKIFSSAENEKNLYMHVELTKSLQNASTLKVLACSLPIDVDAKTVAATELPASTEGKVCKVLGEKQTYPVQEFLGTLNGEVEADPDGFMGKIFAMINNFSGGSLGSIWESLSSIFGNGVDVMPTMALDGALMGIVTTLITMTYVGNNNIFSGENSDSNILSTVVLSGLLGLGGGVLNSFLVGYLNKDPNEGKLAPEEQELVNVLTFMSVAPNGTYMSQHYDGLMTRIMASIEVLDKK